MRFAVGKGRLSPPYPENRNGIAEMQKAILEAHQRAPRDYVHFATNDSDKKSAPCSVFNDRGQLRIGFKKKGVFSDSLESFLGQHFMRNNVFTLPKDTTPKPKRFTRGNPVSEKDSQRLQAQHTDYMRNNFPPSVTQPAVAAASSTHFRQNLQQLRAESPEASFSRMLAPYRTMGRTFFCGTKVPEHIAKISKVLESQGQTEAQKITRIHEIAQDALRKNPLLRDSQLQAFYEKLRDAGSHCSTFTELITTINQPDQRLNARRGPGHP